MVLKVISLAAIIIGCFMLTAALMTTRRIINNRFQIGANWQPLYFLIVLFITGFIVYGLSLFETIISRSDLIVSLLLLGGSLFVFIVSRMNYQNILQMQHIALLERHHALHDSLTGLPNRSLLLERIKQAISGQNPKQKQVSVLLMDLDRFKEINDTLGHVAGDLLIQQIAPRLKKVLRDTDTLARIGGDEFAIVLPDTGSGISQAIALKLIKSLAEPFEVEGHNLNVAMSIGISIYPHDAFDCDTLIQKADIAMYVAKSKQCGYILYDEKLDQYSLNRLKLTGELHKAIKNNELIAYYQPIVDMSKGHITCVEALIRWNHPESGVISPEIFIPLAENAGIMGLITRWVLERALKQMRSWNKQGISIAMHVNLSMSDIQDSNFPKYLNDILLASNSLPAELTLEITENSMMTDLKRAKDVLRQLHQIGVNLAIDDFGTGFSSLSYLKQLPTQEIKIDKSFVMDMLEDDDDAIIVRSTVDLAHNMGRVVTAEGVSDKETYDLLEILGCNRAQGHYICKPLEADELSAWFVKTAWIPGNVYNIAK
ncbi:diguanylate cyclase/phosphodiesterase (GGDEF & EAL domains) with PAS/PAC sensor(s) [hydrothermal vent metagenome]|uniref:Diguanylate cyclase/phosphodiesterase (GGDEF & EAL domains) with PAS/PAC sensor(S) n=1 Tax=hydrothermal vent metagenome TaxID=652676 RepID=A0A3B0ZCH4_9ZZZZ